jgi:nucleotide-binding universal stress UspA family protein
MEIRHILAPTDFSASANQAVTVAFELAQTFGAKLSLLHVIEVPTYAIEVALPQEALERDARRALARLLPAADAAHVDVTRLVDIGVPYQKIVETVTAEQVDLIIMATHGRTGLGHLILGSVAEHVVRLAPCPMLTIRPPGERASDLRTIVI